MALRIAIPITARNAVVEMARAMVAARGHHRIRQRSPHPRTLRINRGSPARQGAIAARADHHRATIAGLDPLGHRGRGIAADLARTGATACHDLIATARRHFDIGRRARAGFWRGNDRIVQNGRRAQSDTGARGDRHHRLHRRHHTRRGLGHGSGHLGLGRHLNRGARRAGRRIAAHRAAIAAHPRHPIHLPAIARFQENTAPAVDPLLPLEPGRRQVGWPADPRHRLRLSRCSAKCGRHNGDRDQFQIHYVPQGEFSQQLGRYWGRFVSE